MGFSFYYVWGKKKNTIFRQDYMNQSLESEQSHLKHSLYIKSILSNVENELISFTLTVSKENNFIW